MSEIMVTRDAERSKSPMPSRTRELPASGTSDSSFSLDFDFAAGFFGLRFAIFMDKRHPPSTFQPLIELPRNDLGLFTGVPDNHFQLGSGFGESRFHIGHGDAL